MQQNKIINTDICVIGAGSGGLSVASGAVQLGMTVTLIEKGDMGGDCLNTGCIPSKALLYAAKSGMDYKDAIAHVAQSIKTIEPHDSVERFEGLGCTVIQSSGRFIDKNRVETDNGYKIKAKFIVIAAGSSPFIPPIKGIDKDKILTNETLFKLTKKPTHLAIIGGGPIGVEMAQAHIQLGCDVTIIDANTIMANDDPEAVDIVRQSLIHKKIKLMENAAITEIKHGDKTHKIILKDGTEIDASHILVATGRAANIDGLNLKNADIEHTKKGIVVNKRMQTNHNNIYAIGDISGGPQFTHVAGYQAGIVVRNICFRLPATVDYKALPWVTYASPELAQVGLNEKSAIEKFGADNIRIMKQDIKGNDRAITENIDHGFVKIIGRNNGKIIGVTIVADNAGDMIAIWALAISKSMKFSDVAGIILPYPTVSEISKGIAGAWYKDQLFSDRTRKIISWLQKLPIF